MTKVIGLFFLAVSLFTVIAGLWNSNIKNCGECIEGTGWLLSGIIGIILIIISGYKSEKN